MESNKEIGKMPLPGGNRQGMPGVSAGRDSMRDTDPALLMRRARRNQEATAQQNNEVDATEEIGDRDLALPGGSLNPSGGGTAAVRRDKPKRIRWTQEMNRNLMRSFYYVTKCSDIPPPGWRSLVLVEFDKIYPELQLSEQSVADRKHVIIKKGYLTPTEIGEIKREVGTQLTVEREDEEVYEMEQTNTTVGTGNDRGTESYVDEFRSNLKFYETIEPLLRPRLPKLQYKPGTGTKVDKKNEILRKHLADVEDMAETHVAIYVAAVTILESNGQNITMNSKFRQPRSEEEPAWKKRLKFQIDSYRTKANLIGEYIKSTDSKKVRRKITSILREYKVEEKDPHCIQLKGQNRTNFVNKTTNYSTQK